MIFCKTTLKKILGKWPYLWNNSNVSYKVDTNTSDETLAYKEGFDVYATTATMQRRKYKNR